MTPGNLTVSDVLTQWMTKAVPNRSLAPATVAKHRAAVTMFRAELGTRRIRALTPEVIEDALERRARSGLSRSTIAAYRSTLILALDWAERRGVIARNVARSPNYQPTPLALAPAAP